MEEKTKSLLFLAAAAVFYDASKPSVQLPVPVKAMVKVSSGLIAAQALEGMGYSRLMSSGIAVLAVGAYEIYQRSRGSLSVRGELGERPSFAGDAWDWEDGFVGAPGQDYSFTRRPGYNDKNY
jgi:hypothetical protein